MTRDKDEFWAIQKPSGELSCIRETRVRAITTFQGDWSIGRGLSTAQKAHWDKLYRQGYRARRVRVEVI